VSLAIIHLYGNLGRDAELRYAQSGNPVLRFTVACSSTQGTGEQRQEHTDWFNVTLFGKRGEALAQYLLKGTRVAVVGRFQHRLYTRQDGTAGCALDVLATEIDFAGGARPEGTPAAQATRGPSRPVEEALADGDVPF
jgi:single-strand DNA-binding protein